MNEPTHLSWNNFLASVYVAGQQRTHRISSSPQIEIFGDGVRGKIGIWLEISAESQIPDQLRRLSFISIRPISKRGKELLEVSCLDPELNRQFYFFAVALADRIVHSGESPIEAFTEELESFASLASEKSLLSIEKQIGLIGELLILEQIIRNDGPAGIQAWVGPTGDPHDFRMRDLEFEVKTTSGTRRIHRISNLTQLMPSPHSSLFVVSVVLGPAGKDNGFSLATKVEDLRELLKPHAENLKVFERYLQSVGYKSKFHAHYSRAFSLRRPLAIIPVNSLFPVVTVSTLSRALGEMAHRIDHLEYDVNVEGLESEEGSSSYSAVIQWTKNLE